MRILKDSSWTGIDVLPVKTDVPDCRHLTSNLVSQRSSWGRLLTMRSIDYFLFGKLFKTLAFFRLWVRRHLLNQVISKCIQWLVPVHVSDVWALSYESEVSCRSCKFHPLERRGARLIRLLMSRLPRGLLINIEFFFHHLFVHLTKVINVHRDTDIRVLSLESFGHVIRSRWFVEQGHEHRWGHWMAWPISCVVLEHARHAILLLVYTWNICVWHFWVRCCWRHISSLFHTILLSKLIIVPTPGRHVG